MSLLRLPAAKIEPGSSTSPATKRNSAEILSSDNESVASEEIVHSGALNGTPAHSDAALNHSKSADALAPTQPRIDGVSRSSTVNGRIAPAAQSTRMMTTSALIFTTIQSSPTVFFPRRPAAHAV